MKYPHINKHIEHDELLDHFTLSAKERHLLAQRRKEVNILGVAVVLKSLIFLGFPPTQQGGHPFLSYILGQRSAGFGCKPLWGIPMEGQRVEKTPCYH